MLNCITSTSQYFPVLVNCVSKLYPLGPWPCSNWAAKGYILSEYMKVLYDLKLWFQEHASNLYYYTTVPTQKSKRAVANEGSLPFSLLGSINNVHMWDLEYGCQLAFRQRVRTWVLSHSLLGCRM